MLKTELIHEDERGSINIVTGLNLYPEITLFETKKGYARGGCIHNLNNENVCVFEGIIRYYWGNENKLLYAGDTIIIPRSSPHYFKSITDSVVAEWGATPCEKKEKHKECRGVVDKINEENRKHQK